MTTPVSHTLDLSGLGYSESPCFGMLCWSCCSANRSALYDCAPCGSVRWQPALSSNTCI